MLHEDLESANKAELLETKYNLLKLQNKCHSNQITQLNRELESSRSEKRALTAQLEKQEARHREDTMVLNFTVSSLREEVEMLQRRNAMLTTILTGETAEDETDGDDVSRDNVSRDDLSRESDALSIVNIEALIAEQIQGVAQID